MALLRITQYTVDTKIGMFQFRIPHVASCLNIFYAHPEIVFAVKLYHENRIQPGVWVRIGLSLKESFA